MHLPQAVPRPRGARTPACRVGTLADARRAVTPPARCRIWTRIPDGPNFLIAGIIQDRTYFREQVEPYLDGTIRYIGPVDVAGKNELFRGARALLHLNTIPERFGLVLVEANAAGVPVIAMDLGSCREVIEEGQTGFLVDNVHEAARALERVSAIDRGACRQRVQERFSIVAMVEAYERVYQTIFELEALRQ